MTPSKHEMVDITNVEVLLKGYMKPERAYIGKLLIQRVIAGYKSERSIREM